MPVTDADGDGSVLATDSPAGRTADRSVTVVGVAERTFDVMTLDGMDGVERSYTIACASGRRTTDRWTGVPVSDLLDAVDAPPETTHLRLEARDGYCVCVPIRDALDGVVAYARGGRLLSESRAYALRFLADGASGERLVMGLRRIEALELAAGDDPDRLETVAPDGPTFG